MDTPFVGLRVRRVVRLVRRSMILLMLFALGMGARPVPPLQAAQSLPGVGRLSYLEGDASIVHPDVDAPIAAVMNAPLLDGDEVATNDSSIAEIEYTPHIMVRAGNTTQIRFLSFAWARRVAQLERGTVEVSILRDWHGHPPTLETPFFAVLPTYAGIYRVTVNPNGTAELTVRQGRATVYTADGRRDALPGSTMIASGSFTHPLLRLHPEIAGDTFDAFNYRRNEEIARTLQGGETHFALDGTADLAPYGSWVADAEYGSVWVPNEPVAWSPYQNGRWVWEVGYGWTWIGTEPWGWAPYHYGRWFHRPAHGWAWVPPRPTIAPPDWSPALVGFAAVGSGVGWVALAPHDHARPWWRWQPSSPPTSYENARYAGAVTAVPREDFRSGHFEDHFSVNMRSARRLEWLHSPLSIKPTTASVKYHLTASNLPTHTTRHQYVSLPASSRLRSAPLPQIPHRTLPVDPSAVQLHPHAVHHIPQRSIEHTLKMENHPPHFQRHTGQGTHSHAHDVQEQKLHQHPGTKSE